MKKYIIGMMAALTIGAVLIGTEVHINRTSSLPHSVFLVIKFLPMQKGDLVSIRGHQPKYVPNITLTKRIVGVASDEVPCGAKLKNATQQGHPLSALCVHEIPRGYVYVQADHPDSFDSRYNEFGLVRVDHLIGRAIPLW